MSWPSTNWSTPTLIDCIQTRFWTVLSYSNGLISTLLISFSIPKRNYVPLSAVPEVQENGQYLPFATYGFRFTLCRFFAWYAKRGTRKTHFCPKARYQGSAPLNYGTITSDFLAYGVAERCWQKTPNTVLRQYTYNIHFSSHLWLINNSVQLHNIWIFF